MHVVGANVEYDEVLLPITRRSPFVDQAVDVPQRGVKDPFGVSEAAAVPNERVVEPRPIGAVCVFCDRCVVNLPEPRPFV